MKKELTTIEKAMQFFLSEDIECFEREGSLYILVKDFHVEVSEGEIEYRAEHWGDNSDTITL